VSDGWSNIQVSQKGRFIVAVATRNGEERTIQVEALTGRLRIADDDDPVTAEDPVVQCLVDEAQNRGPKRFGIPTLLLRQKPQANERVDFRYVQRDADVLLPVPPSPPVEAHCFGARWAQRRPGRNRRHLIVVEQVETGRRCTCS
jgi:hypothetical protein